MNKVDATNVLALFAKSAREAVGVAISEWKGEPRIDVRIYVPIIGEDSLVPTKKGISLSLDQYPQLLDGVRRLGDVMSNERVVARIGKSERSEVRIGITIFRGNPLIYLRTFVQFGSDDPEWKPTQKGVSLRVDLYPKLLEAIEAAGSEIDARGENSP